MLALGHFVNREAQSLSSLLKGYLLTGDRASILTRVFMTPEHWPLTTMNRYPDRPHALIHSLSAPTCIVPKEPATKRSKHRPGMHDKKGRGRFPEGVLAQHGLERKRSLMLSQGYHEGSTSYEHHDPAVDYSPHPPLVSWFPMIALRGSRLSQRQNGLII